MFVFVSFYYNAVLWILPVAEQARREYNVVDNKYRDIENEIK